MFKDGSNPRASSGASEATPLERGGGSGSNGRLPLQDEIGFVGLGHMGTAMAANLAAAGHRVIAYVRRPDQMGKLEALGLKPTTEIADLFDCEVVISMLPDDDAVREVVFGREDLGIERSRRGIEARRNSSFDEHDQHGRRVSPRERACASRTRLRRSAGVRKSGCRQGAPALHRRRRRRRPMSSAASRSSTVSDNGRSWSAPTRNTQTSSSCSAT